MLSVSNMKFSIWADKWLEIKKSEVRGSSYMCCKQYVNNHYTPAFQKYKLCQINEQHVRKFIADLKNENGLSSETIRKIFFSLNDLLNSALKHRNPMKDLKPPKVKQYKPKVPTNGEYDLLLNTVANMPDKTIILLGGMCGMRLGEIFALKWIDIDFKNKRLIIDETRAITEDGYTETDTKSERSNRIIVVQEFILDLLKALKPEYENKNSNILNIKDKQDFEEDIKYNLIFTMRPDSYSSRFGNIIKYHNELFDLAKNNQLENHLKFHGPTSIKKQIIIQNKPLPDITFHSLRHYHASTLYRKGLPDQYIADRCGHDVFVQKKVYQHILEDHQTELDDLIINLKPGE